MSRHAQNSCYQYRFRHDSPPCHGVRQRIPDRPAEVRTAVCFYNIRSALRNFVEALCQRHQQTHSSPFPNSLYPFSIHRHIDMAYRSMNGPTLQFETLYHVRQPFSEKIYYCRAVLQRDTDRRRYTGALPFFCCRKTQPTAKECCRAQPEQTDTFSQSKPGFHLLGNLCHSFLSGMIGLAVDIFKRNYGYTIVIAYGIYRFIYFIT